MVTRFALVVFGTAKHLRGTQVECLQGKGTMSSTAEYGRSIIPAAKDTGRSYKAINLMDARCEFFRGFLLISTFLATFFVEENTYIITIWEEKSGKPKWDMPGM